MQPAVRFDEGLSGTEVQMVRVREDHLRARRFQMLDRQALDRRRGAHRHESGSVDRAVGSLHPSAARSTSGVYGEQTESQRRSGLRVAHP